MFVEESQKVIFWKFLLLFFGLNLQSKIKLIIYVLNLIEFTLFRVRNQKTLFLDLDETLIHSCSLQDNPQYVVDGNLFKERSNVNINKISLMLIFFFKVWF